MIQKSLLLITAFVAIINAAFTQHNTNTYAIIIGISNYESEQIDDLSFADADALAFTAYLQSPAGGNIPTENIQLLLNEAATIAAITHSMQWLAGQCKANDRAYIYFSGHGDVETEKDANNGYLLAYNSPPHSYRNNAIGVNAINDLANHLSLTSNAHTVIITDACRSGKLAGNIINGKQLVSNQLKKVLNNEVRLISSGAEELSAEGRFWGGGRGVFSFYLIQGLQGWADANNDKKVQLNELTNYLETSFKNDRTLAALQHKQTPMTDGNPQMTVALVNNEVLSNIKVDDGDNPSGLISAQLAKFKKARPGNLELFMQLMEKLPIESMINFENINQLLAKSFPAALIDAYIQARDSLLKGDESPLRNTLAQEEIFYTNLDIDFEKLQSDLVNQPTLFQHFNKRFIEIIHQKGQSMINAFLNGDIAELEKRQYYYSGLRSYEDYVSLVLAAKSIMPAGDQLEFLIQLHEHYVKGLVIRLKMLTNKESKLLLPQSLQHQFTALNLDPYAAPALNEIGNLQLQLSNFDSAAYYYKQASLQAPTWAIPWSNKIRLGLARNNLQAAKEAADITDELQPNISYVLINKGLLYEKLNNLLEAESAYLKAIAQNNVHYLPYERLAHLYMHYGAFEKADQYFFEAESRKIEFAVNDLSFNFGVELGGYPPLEDISQKNNCPAYDSATNTLLLPYYQLGNALKAMQDSALDQQTSVKLLLKILQSNAKLPLAYHYVGQYYAKHGTWQQAIPFLQKAIELKKNSFEKEVFQDTCLLVMLRFYDYDELEDYYLLASLYEKNNFTGDAVKLYESAAIIENNRLFGHASLQSFQQALSWVAEMPNFNSLEVTQKTETPLPVLGYIKAARILLATNQYDLAETLLLKQVSLSRQAGNNRAAIIRNQSVPHIQYIYPQGSPNTYWLNINYLIENEVYNFYKNVTSAYPRYPEWHEKAGIFLYQRLKLAYDKLQPNQFKDFLKVYKENGYPWIVSEGGTYYYPTQFNLPGTTDSLIIFVDEYHPVQEALNYLEQYEKLMLSIELKPEIIQAMAELNSWMGNKQKAMYYYKIAIQKNPENNSLKLKYIDYLKAVHELPEAYAWLQVLEKTNALPNKQLPYLIQYQIILKAYTDAQKNIDLAISNQAIVSSEWHQLNIFNNMQAKKYTVALPHLKALQTEAKNESKEAWQAPSLSLALLYYAEASVYLRQNKSKPALNTLKKALDSGFDYAYLLRNDPLWQNIKKSDQWEKLLSMYNFSREYNTGGMYANFIPLREIVIPE